MGTISLSFELTYLFTLLCAVKLPNKVHQGPHTQQIVTALAPDQCKGTLDKSGDARDVDTDWETDGLGSFKRSESSLDWLSTTPQLMSIPII